MINIESAMSAKPVSRPGMPFAESRIALFLSKRIDQLAARKNQREIATEIGYDKPNMISMFKRGETKIPLEKIPLLAKSLEVDPAHLFRMAVEQYWPGLHAVIQEVFGHVVSDNESVIIKEIRKLTDNGDPPMTKELKAGLKALFADKH